MPALVSHGMEWVFDTYLLRDTQQRGLSTWGHVSLGSTHLWGQRVSPWYKPSPMATSTGVSLAPFHKPPWGTGSRMKGCCVHRPFSRPPDQPRPALPVSVLYCHDLPAHIPPSSVWGSQGPGPVSSSLPVPRPLQRVLEKATKGWASSPSVPSSWPCALTDTL